MIRAGSTFNASVTSMNSTTSSRRSPRSYLLTKDWGREFFGQIDLRELGVVPCVDERSA